MIFGRLSSSKIAWKVAAGASAPIALAWGYTTSSSSSTSSMEASCCNDKNKHRILIVGGGTAGIGIAAQLRHKGEKDVAILDPSDAHYYQPMWTLVGGGIKDNTQSKKAMSDVIPHGVHHIQDAAAAFDPSHNTVRTKDGKELKYDYLVVATGIQQHFDRIPGLKETIGKNGVVSIYDYHQSQLAQQAIANTTKGNLLFTQHSDSPIKCGGAPQKIMWLAEDIARRAGYRSNVSVQWLAPQPSMFPVRKYGDILTQEADERGIERNHGWKLIQVDGPQHVATFQSVSDPSKTMTKSFDLLHVIPFMSPPKAITESPLADKTGFVDVDKNTLQHKTYPNVFAAGDSANLPTSKTMAAVAKQAPILVHNLLAHANNETMTANYDGYTSCPITTKKDRLLLAEFKYGGELAETFPFLQSSPRRVFMFFKETLFPLAYFELYLRGHWYGPRTIFSPSFPKTEPVPGTEKAVALSPTNTK